MKEEINRIIEIDKMTSDDLKETEAKIEQMQEDLKDRLASLENEENKKAKEDAQKAFDEIIAKGETESQELREKNAASLKRIEQRYEEQKEELLEKAFRQFILDGGNA